jgi:hypothetical protein
MKNIREKFNQHRIEPTEKAWERIEASLDNNKVRKLPLSLRWAAAAVSVGVAAVVAMQFLQPTKVDTVTSVAPKNPSVAPAIKANTLDKNTVVMPTEAVATTKNNVPQQMDKNSDATITSVPTVEKKEDKQQVENKVEKESVVKVTPQEKINLQPVYKMQSIDIQAIASIGAKPLPIASKKLNLQPMPIDEDNLLLYFDEDIRRLVQNNSDSTLSEKLIRFGQIKAKQMVARAFRPK